MIKDAMLWEPIADEGVHCFVCAHECKIKKWDRVFCHVRQNLDGKLATLIYAEVSSMNVDPIEKKPLFHFYPGSKVFSLGSVAAISSVNTARTTIFRLLKQGNWALQRFCQSVLSSSPSSETAAGLRGRIMNRQSGLSIPTIRRSLLKKRDCIQYTSPMVI